MEELVTSRAKTNNDSVQLSLEAIAPFVLKRVEDRYDMLTMAQALNQLSEILIQKVIVMNLESSTNS